MAFPKRLLISMEPSVIYDLRGDITRRGKLPATAMYSPTLGCVKLVRARTCSTYDFNLDLVLFFLLQHIQKVELRLLVYVPPSNELKDTVIIFHFCNKLFFTGLTLYLLFLTLAQITSCLLQHLRLSRQLQHP